jgi:replicative DNA helicase
LDEYEQIIVYKALTDEKYLATVVDHINPTFFKDKNIKSIFEIIKNFYIKRNTVPTVSELKTYIINQ